MSKMVTLFKGPRANEPQYVDIIAHADAHDEIAEILADDHLDADQKLARVLEGSGWEMLRHGVEPDEIGGLTEAPMLSDETAHDDRTNAFTHIGRIYWYPDYAVSDPVEVLARNGHVRFPLGEDMAEQFTELAQLRKLAQRLADFYVDWEDRVVDIKPMGRKLRDRVADLADTALRITDQFGPYDTFGEKLAWQQCALCWKEAVHVGKTPDGNRCAEHAGQ